MKSNLKTIGLLAVALLWCAQTKADHLLYATDGQALYTVDLDTGERTFQSDGPLQWLASPAFDEPHHTVLRVEGNTPGGWGWLPADGAHWYWGNPTTGDHDGPFPATLSMDYSLGETGLSFSNVVVYAPTTQHLYAIGVWYPDPCCYNFAVALVDHHNQPPLAWWLGGGPYFEGIVISIAAAFDPVSGFIVVAYNQQGTAYSPSSVFLWPFDLTISTSAGATVPNWWLEVQLPDVCVVQALAVDPATANLYAVVTYEQSPTLSQLIKVTPRIDVAIGSRLVDFTSIAVWPYAPWQMTFANGKYVQ